MASTLASVERNDLRCRSPRRAPTPPFRKTPDTRACGVLVLRSPHYRIKRIDRKMDCDAAAKGAPSSTAPAPPFEPSASGQVVDANLRATAAQGPQQSSKPRNNRGIVKKFGSALRAPASSERCPDNHSADFALTRSTADPSGKFEIPVARLHHQSRTNCRWLTPKKLGVPTDIREPQYVTYARRIVVGRSQMRRCRRLLALLPCHPRDRAQRASLAAVAYRAPPSSPGERT